MVAPEVRVPTRRLREAVADLVERTSLRKAATDVGVSHMGLRRLLAGAEPQRRTRLKLEAWFVRKLDQEEVLLDAETAGSVLRLLVANLAHSRRGQVSSDVVRCLVQAYHRCGSDQPEWLTSLAARLQANESDSPP